MVSTRYWVWLQCCIHQGSALVCDILDVYGDPQRFYEAVSSCDPDAGLKELTSITNSQLQKCKNTPLDIADKIISDCQRVGCDILCYDAPEFPDRLRHIYAPPAVLYQKGTLAGLDQIPAIAMVGTRKMTPYGKKVAVDFGTQLARAGICVISGMAVGVDIMSMKAALKAGGYVIGVLGCGIDVNYPAENAKMKGLVSKYGCIVTEYPPGTGPWKGNFPARNRLISGLSLGTLVIQAPKHSGSLITADDALEQGKDLFVVPAPLYDPTVSGNLRLLRDGCIPATEPADVIDFYRFRYERELLQEQRKNKARLTGEPLPALEEETDAPLKEQAEIEPDPEYSPKLSQQNRNSGQDGEDCHRHSQDPKVSEEALQVYRVLSEEPVHMEEIAQTLGMRISQVLGALTELEIAGAVRSYAGRRYGK